MLKTCTRCKVEKSIDQFGTDKYRKDGIYPVCRECKNRGTVKSVEPPAERQCNRCGEVKPIRSFGTTKKRQDGRTTICNFCRAPHRKKDSHCYQRRKARVADRNKRVRTEVKSALIAALGGRCHDCGLEPSAEWPIACFDFHHNDPSLKDTEFARRLGIKKYTKSLMREAESCTLLCSNCHRRRHANDEAAYSMATA